MNILVIGNGFDLAHSLPTKYSQFLKFICEYVESCNTECGDSTDSQFAADIMFIKENHPDIYEEIQSLIIENSWVDYFMQKNEELILEGKEGWIDFESEISSIIQALEAVRAELKESYAKGKTKVELNHYWNEILYPILIPKNYHTSSMISLDMRGVISQKEKLLADLNRLTRCLEIYLSYVIARMDCTKIPIIESLTIHRVISFNYTNTFQRIYDNGTEIKYDYIHGQASENSSLETCNLVIGIDEYQDLPNRDVDNEFVRFKKFYQRIYKMTGCQFVDWLTQRRELISKHPNLRETIELNIYFYGHSLDVTDKDILQKLILEDGANTVIFYHMRSSPRRRSASWMLRGATPGAT